MHDPGGLYPFLHGDAAAPALSDQALGDSVCRKVADSLAAKQAFFASCGIALIEAARALAAVYRRGGRLLTMGNGGSACDAAHLAVEFQHPVTPGRAALPALNLVMDTAMLTAVANDIGSAQIFARQLRAQARAGDALFGFSTSGNSANLLAAYATARELGLTTLGLAGGDGGEMRRSGLVEHCLVVDSRSIHRVQEVHVTAYHILWDLVHTLLADQRGPIHSGDEHALR